MGARVKLVDRKLQKPKKFGVHGNRKTPIRKKGTPHRITVALKDAIMLNAAAVGDPTDPTKKKTLDSYLQFLARTEPKAYAGLLGKVLPMTINVNHGAAQPIDTNLSVREQQRVYAQVVQQLRDAPSSARTLLPGPDGNDDGDVVDAEFEEIET